ncbi:DUF488 family protein [Microbacterium sp. NPDC089987]|uniref:DUF488 domain-containing protein n=1 Tax=Microbacterium sp. NPDC089987 TaxID=3364202 RepID=UPI00381EE281
MILTVGHSTHPLDEFTELLRAAEVGALIDVRRLPGSNRYPWFNADALAASLPEHGIRYLRIEQLGGRRNLQRQVPDEVNGVWRNRSFHNYADYALSGDFAEGIEQLLSVDDSVAGRAAVMCSEAVWWRCHRRIIADHLLARDIEVGHLMPDGRVAEASLTPGAVVRDGVVEYPSAD